MKRLKTSITVAVLSVQAFLCLILLLLRSRQLPSLYSIKVHSAVTNAKSNTFIPYLSRTKS